jgi:proteasome lid subunit RPN8/RPN11
MHLVLRLTKNHWETVTAHLTQHLPNEACGLLAGRDGQVQKVYLITNIDHSPVSYQMAPAELLQALNELDERGWDLLAIFHSHPAGPPTPSPTDVSQAYYPDSAYAIFSLANNSLASNQWQARVFEIKNSAVRELTYEIILP